MSQQQISHGPGNANPVTEYRKFKCNGAITKGEFVALYGTTGYTIDQANATTLIPIGVAAESGVDGGWIDVIVSGKCNYLTNDGTDVVAYDLLVSDASGHAVPYTAAEAATNSADSRVIGQSLEAETSTTCTNVYIYKKI